MSQLDQLKTEIKKLSDFVDSLEEEVDCTQEAYMKGFFDGVGAEQDCFEQESITGWIARDDDLNHIHLFQNKPIRDKWAWHSGCPALQLPDEFMSTLKWEDEPIEVKFLIKPIKK